MSLPRLLHAEADNSAHKMLPLTDASGIFKRYIKDPQTVEDKVIERYDSPQCSWEAGRTFDLQRRSQRSETKRQIVISADRGAPH